MDCTITLYNVHLIPLLMWLSSQTCNLDSFNQALAALAILLLTSALVERSEDWMLPRYLNLEICCISCSEICSGWVWACGPAKLHEFCLGDTHLHPPIFQCLLHHSKHFLQLLTVLLKNDHIISI